MTLTYYQLSVKRGANQGEPDNEDYIMVVGHTPTQCIKADCNKPLYLRNKIIMVDTGSFLPEGKISCVDLTNRKSYSA